MVYFAKKKVQNSARNSQQQVQTFNPAELSLERSLEITKVEGDEVKASFVGEITFSMPTETSYVGLYTKTR